MHPASLALHQARGVRTRLRTPLGQRAATTLLLPAAGAFWVKGSGGQGGSACGQGHSGAGMRLRSTCTARQRPMPDSPGRHVAGRAAPELLDGAWPGLARDGTGWAASLMIRKPSPPHMEEDE